MTDEINNPAFPAGRSVVSVTSEIVGGVVVVSVHDVVDAATAPELSSAINEVIDGAPAGLVLDLTAVTFLASAGMTVLMKARERAGDLGFAVVANTPATFRPLTLLGLDSELTICATVDEALRRVQR
ncbi:anti-anti-sigma factor [Mycobacterium sp. ITM-2017-0098]|nr:anti-anti-sigma factor [Mycobacterium sp. ITM-2017-0098]